MGTRGMIGLVSDGTVYGTYNHYDSYPRALGVNIAAFVTYVKDVGAERIKEQVTRLRFVSEDAAPTALDRKRLSHLTDTGVSTGEDWYAVLRNAQGNLKAYLDAEVWVDQLSFAGDSLFCEWAYLVNLDDSTVEFYKGFNKGFARGRFANLPMNDGYGPVTLLAVVPFDLAVHDAFWVNVEDILYQAEEKELDVPAVAAAYVKLAVKSLTAAADTRQLVRTKTTVRIRSHSVSGWIW